MRRRNKISIDRDFIMLSLGGFVGFMAATNPDLATEFIAALENYNKKKPKKK